MTLNAAAYPSGFATPPFQTPGPSPMPSPLSILSSSLAHTLAGLNSPRVQSTTDLTEGEGKLVGSIDAGTSSVRFILFDSRARLIASHAKEFTQYFDHPGWQDQDAHEIVDAVNECIDEAVKKLEEAGKYSRKDIKVIGITNQRETTVVWDKATGKALHRAIAWPDTRTVATVHKLSESHPDGVDAVRKETGLPLSTYFAALKLRWMLDNVPEVKKAHDEGSMLFGTVDSWLLYNLTGGAIHATDSSNASRTMLMDLETQAWCPKLCGFFGVDMKVLPEVRSSSEVYGKVKEGTLQGVEIAAMIGDQMAALVGNKCLSPGQAKNTYGTGAFLLYHTGDKIVRSKNGLLTTIAYKAGPKAEPQYALEGSIAVAGSAVKWLRDSLKLIKDAPEAASEAASVEDSGGVYFVTAFSGLFCPYWDDTATGTIVGMSGYTTKAHICRATLESVCYQTKDILDAMQKDSGIALSELQVDGGLTNADICMQIQSDILNIPVERPEMRESTALGSALLAASAVGLFGWDVNDPETLKEVNTEGKERFESRIDEERRRKMLRGWKRAVERSRGWNKEDDEDREEEMYEASDRQGKRKAQRTADLE